MTIIEHLAEFRTRLFIALLAWIVGAGFAFAFNAEILEWMRAPLANTPIEELTSLELLEPFLVLMQIAAFFGFVLSSPIIFGQIWGFISPGLYQEERRWAVPFILFMFLAFAGGILFSYYIVLPLALPIILGFLGSEINIQLRIGDYISKIILYMAVFGILFEMPVVGFLFARLGFIQSALLIKFRRYSIVIGMVLAAFLTPTADPFNFALVAIPLVILYEITIIVVRLSQRQSCSNP